METKEAVNSVPQAPQPERHSLFEHVPIINRGLRDSETNEFAKSIIDRIFPMLKQGFRIINSSPYRYVEDTVVFLKSGERHYEVTLERRRNRRGFLEDRLDMVDCDSEKPRKAVFIKTKSGDKSLITQNFMSSGYGKPIRKAGVLLHELTTAEVDRQKTVQEKKAAKKTAHASPFYRDVVWANHHRSLYENDELSKVPFVPSAA